MITSRARLVAEIACPASVADTGAVVVAGSAVLARAVAPALGTVTARLTERLAAHSSVAVVAQTLAGHRVAPFGVRRVTVARFRAIQAEIARRTRAIAGVLFEAGAAQTGAGHVMARGPIVTGALLLAAVAVESRTTRRLAQQAGPAGRALAQTVRVRAIAPVLAFALIRAFVAVVAFRARALAVHADVT